MSWLPPVDTSRAQTLAARASLSATERGSAGYWLSRHARDLDGATEGRLRQLCADYDTEAAETARAAELAVNPSSLYTAPAPRSLAF